jgi:hypothetical protein
VTFRFFFNLPGVFEKTGTFIADISWIPPGKLDFAGIGCFYPVLDQNCCHTKDKTYSAVICLKQSSAFFGFTFNFSSKH